MAGPTRIPNGGGISNKGRLTLRDVVVRDNRAVRGGGIYNDGRCGCWVAAWSGTTRTPMSRGKLRERASTTSVAFILDDRTRIRNNLGCTPVVNEGTLRMKGASDISGNFPMRGPAAVASRTGAPS